MFVLDRFEFQSDFEPPLFKRKRIPIIFTKVSSSMTEHKDIIIGYMGCLQNEHGETVGVKGVGKDTSASMLQQRLNSEYECHMMAFADGLKTLIANYYHMDRFTEDTPEKKEMERLNYPGWSWRRFLEVFGTNVIRQGLSEHFPELQEKLESHWYNQVEHKIKRLQLNSLEKLIADTWQLSNRELFEHPRDTPLPGIGRSFNELYSALTTELQKHQFPTPVNHGRKPLLIQITDVRFPNEYHRLKALGAHMVRISRTIPGLKMPEVTHPSNRVYEEMIPDMIVDNNGSKFMLRQNISVLKNMLTPKEDI